MAGKDFWRRRKEEGDMNKEHLAEGVTENHGGKRNKRKRRRMKTRKRMEEKDDECFEKGAETERRRNWRGDVKEMRKTKRVEN